MSEFRQKGDKLHGKYRVISRFPFVDGVLYYAEVTESRAKGETRFIHAVRLPGSFEPDRLEEFRFRNGAVFFPVSEVFVEDGVLHQVFDRLEGDLLGFRLLRSAPISVPETAEIVKQLAGHVLTCYEEGQFAPLDPQNLVRTAAGEIRFLYGGPARLLGRMKNEPEDVKRLASLVVLMLTGKRAGGDGRTEPLRSLCGDMPPELENLVVRALSPDPLIRPRLHDFRRWGHGSAAHALSIEMVASAMEPAVPSISGKSAGGWPENRADERAKGGAAMNRGNLRREWVWAALAFLAGAVLALYFAGSGQEKPLDVTVSPLQMKLEKTETEPWSRDVPPG